MKRRWVLYLAIGALFGIFDFVYLEFLYRVPWDRIFGFSPAGTLGWFVRFVVLNIGLWLVPVLPVALYEGRISRLRLRSAGASLSVWCAAIVAYYLAYAAELAFWGTPGRPELHISNRGSEYFWQNWSSVFQGTILRGIAEWIVLAVVGGAIVGFLTTSIYLHVGRRWEMTHERI